MRPKESESSGSSPPHGRRLQGPVRNVRELLASSPNLERYVVLISAYSHSFLNVEPPPHAQALKLADVRSGRQGWRRWAQEAALAGGRRLHDPLSRVPPSPLPLLAR